MKKTKINNKIFCSLLLFVLVASITLTATPVSAATINTCDSGGTAQTTFNPGEDVYFTASGLTPSATYPIYVFIKNGSWTTGMVFPTRYYNTANSITSDGSGNISPTVIYTKITAGEYYVAVDINSNGVYDAGDLLSTNLVVTLEVTTKTSGGAIISTAYLNPEDLYAMPSYTGVGCPRRSGGFFPLQMLGNYTGVPLVVLCSIVGGINSNSIITLSTDVDGASGILTYGQVHDSIITPQYNISTGAVITGQQPMWILAYQVNGTMLSSDGSGLGSNTDLGGPLRVIVVSNNGTSMDLACDGMATFGNNYVKAVTKIVITIPSELSYNTVDEEDNPANYFGESSTVCFSATGFSASTNYTISVVEHSSLAVRISLPVSTSVISVTTNPLGEINTVTIYVNAASGNYDVLIDLNNNGIFDEADTLVYNIADHTFGFSVE
jgi:hypothetical protein